MDRAFVLLSLLFAVATAQFDCTWTDAASGAKFDLSPLKLNSIPDYRGSESVYTYYMNICDRCHNSNCGNQWSIIQMSDSFMQAGVEPGNPNKGVQLTFTNGQSCVWPGGNDRTATVQIHCNQATPAPTTFTIEENRSSGQCTDTITVQALAGCPLGGGGDNPTGLSGGSIFLIIVFCAVLPVYIIAGCVYKTKTKGTSGVESCPNIDFWKHLPGLVKDGCMFTLNKIRALTGKGGSSYSQV